MVKKSVSILLCILLLFGITTGCATTEEEGSEYYYVDSFITTTKETENDVLGGSTSGGSKTGAASGSASSGKGTSANSNVTSNLDSSTVEQETKGRFDVDLSGTTINLLTWYTPEDWEQAIYDEFCAKTGAKIKFIPTGTSSVTQKLTALIAANNAPDATMMGGSQFPQFITKNLAQPLTKYVDTKKDTWLAYDIMDMCKYNGEYYGITDHFWGDDYFVYYNKKIFNSSTNVKSTPLDLYNAGKWTWDAFYDLAEKLTVKDKNGNVTQWGAKSAFVNCFGLSAGASAITINNGKVTNTLNSTEMKNAFTFVQKLYKNNYYTKDQGSWESGNVAMYIYPQYPLRVDNYSSWKGVDYDWVPFPTYTQGASYQPTDIQLGIVPRKAKNPEAGYLLLNWRAYCQENMKAISNTNQEWIERYKKAVTGKTKCSLEVGILGDDVWTLYGELSDPEKSLQSTIDSWSSVIDGKIKSYEKEVEDYKFN